MALTAVPLQAVRITGELFAEDRTRTVSVTLNGPDFSIRTSFDVAFSGPFAFFSECAAAFPGCGPGDLVPLNGVLVGDVGASGTIDGVFYPNLSLGSSVTDTGTVISFNAPTITLTDSLVYTAPVNLSGTLAAYVGNIGLDLKCVLCESVGDPSIPSFDMPLRVTGFGRATLTLIPNPFPLPGSDPFVLESVVYQFEIPEPSTFLLMCAALTAYGIVRVLKRRRTQCAGIEVSMRVWILLATVMVLGAVPLQAVRITGELLAEDRPRVGSLTLNGPNFSIRTSFNPAASLLAFSSECMLALGCGPGDPVSLNGGISTENTGPTSGTIDGVFYPTLSLGSSATDAGTLPIFNAPTITLTDSLVYTVPLNLWGWLAAYVNTPTGLKCVLCESVGDPNIPSLDMALRITGFGRGTLRLIPNPLTLPPSEPFVFDSVVYQFEIPEPPTFALTGGALAAYVILRLAPRYRAQRAENR